MFCFDIANLHRIPVYHNFSVTERVGARNGKPCELPNVCFLETYHKQSDCILVHNLSGKENFATRGGLTCNLPTPYVLL